MIGIDAGTRVDSAKAAYEALRTYAPTLPELTTISSLILIGTTSVDTTIFAASIGNHGSTPEATITKKSPANSARRSRSLNISLARASTSMTCVTSSRTEQSIGPPT